MFGYIHIDAKELSAQDRKIYQAYYCGLCRCLKNDFGIHGQLLLNYDMTFLTVLLSGIYRMPHKKAEFICPVHPGKKKLAVLNEATRYAAAMSVLLSYYNLQEETMDDRNVSKLMILKLLEKDHIALSDRFPRQSAAMAEYIRAIALYEANREQNMDLIAGLTGDMLGEIYAWKDDEYSEELRHIGYHIGKFIYLMDAYKDLEKDSRNRDYNAFSTMDVERPRDRETISRLILNSLIAECARSYERLPYFAYDSIIRNVFYYGVWGKYEALHSKRMKRQERTDKKDYRNQVRQQKNEIRDLKRIETRIKRAKRANSRRETGS